MLFCHIFTPQLPNFSVLHISPRTVAQHYQWKPFVKFGPALPEQRSKRPLKSSPAMTERNVLSLRDEMGMRLLRTPSYVAVIFCCATLLSAFDGLSILSGHCTRLIQRV